MAAIAQADRPHDGAFELKPNGEAGIDRWLGAALGYRVRLRLSRLVTGVAATRSREDEKKRAAARFHGHAPHACGPAIFRK